MAAVGCQARSFSLSEKVLKKYHDTFHDDSGSAARAVVKVGDVLVAIQNASVQGQSLEYVLDFIGKAPRVVNLRFLRKNDVNA